MEGSMPHTVILQSIKIPCLKKRWEMTAIQNPGAWGSLCFDQISIWSLRSLWTTTAARAQKECVRTPPSFEHHLQCKVGAVPRGTEPLRPAPEGSSCQLLCCLWDQPFPISSCAPWSTGFQGCPRFMSPQGQENESKCWGHETFLAVQSYNNDIQICR